MLQALSVDLFLMPHAGAHIDTLTVFILLAQSIAKCQLLVTDVLFCPCRWRVSQLLEMLAGQAQSHQMLSV